MNLPDWVGPVAEYVFEVGLVNTLKISAMALVGSTVDRRSCSAPC